MASLSLLAANKSAATIATYLQSLRQMTQFLQVQGMPTTAAAVRREHVEAFMVYLLTHYKPATARNRYTGLQPFFRWLTGPLPQPLPPDTLPLMAAYQARATTRHTDHTLKAPPTHSSAQRHPHYPALPGKPKQRQQRQPFRLSGGRGSNAARPRPSGLAWAPSLHDAAPRDTPVSPRPRQGLASGGR